MSKYYCHECARRRGYLGEVDIGSLMGTNFQLEKYMKHTCPASSEAIQSVFAMASTSAYGAYVVNATLAGSVEIEDKGRTNIIWADGKEIGFKYEHGELKYPEHVVKVVLSTDSGRVHAYPQSSTEFAGASCLGCGGAVLH
jgi:hypothetical protein